MNRPHLSAAYRGILRVERPRLVLPSQVQRRPLTSRVWFWLLLSVPVWALFMAFLWILAGYIYPGS